MMTRHTLVGLVVIFLNCFTLAYSCSEKDYNECLSTLSNYNLRRRCHVFCQHFNINFDHTTLNIQCNSNPTSYEAFPNLTKLATIPRNISSVVITGCPFLRNETFSSLLSSKFPTNAIRSLEIRYLTQPSYLISKKDLEGFSTLQELYISNNVSFANDFLIGTPNLTVLDINNTSMRYTDNFIDNIPNLHELHLSYIALEKIPNSKKLKSLFELIMWKNNLTTITSETFKNLTNLHSLDLHGNKIEYIAVDAFAPLKKLSALTIEFGNIKRLDRSIFKNNPSLANVTIILNSNVILDDYLFANFQFLHKLILASSSLSQIPEHMIENSKNLTILYLQENNIETLPTTLFKDNVNMEVLDLSFNKLKKLPSKIFSSLTKLKYLFLNNNLITELEDTLNNLSSLEELFLNDNNIVNIHNDEFNNMKNLRLVYLQHNKLTMPSEVLRNMFIFKPQLEFLDLSNNKITDLNLANIINRQVETKLEINLSSNKIDWVNFRQIQMDNLKHYMGNTEIKINNNPLKCDCTNLHLIQFIKNPKEYDIHLNSLLRIDVDKCDDNKPIEELTPDELNCPITCPLAPDIEVQSSPKCNCYHYPYTETLFFNCTKKSFSDYPRLQMPTDRYIKHVDVNLDGNLLKGGPPNDSFWINVRRLDLQNNLINNITWIPPHIQILKLHSNNISVLDDSFFEAVNATKSLENLTLHNNPWKCDCSTKNLVNFLTDHHSKIYTNKIYCNGTRKMIMKLLQTEYCKSYTVHYLIWTVVIVVVLLVTAIAVIIYNTFKDEIKLWLYTHDIWLMPEEKFDKNKKYDVFISYAKEDEKFVEDELLPFLENEGSRHYKACVHVRDWTPGAYIDDQIISSVQDSRRTLVVLSRNFTKSTWGTKEFRFAHHEAVKQGKTRIIMVIYDDVEKDDNLDEEFKLYIKMNTYIKWGDRWFWTKLTRALPEYRIKKKSKSSKKLANLVMTIDDRFDPKLQDNCKLDSDIQRPVYKVPNSEIGLHPLLSTGPTEKC